MKNASIRLFFSFLIVANPTVAATLAYGEDSKADMEWASGFPEEEDGEAKESAKKGEVDDSEVYLVQSSVEHMSQMISNFSSFFNCDSLISIPDEVTTPPPKV